MVYGRYNYHGLFIAHQAVHMAITAMGFHCEGLWSSPRNQKTWPLPGDLLCGLWPTPLCLLKFTMGPCRGQKMLEVLEVAMVHIKYCSKMAMK